MRAILLCRAPTSRVSTTTTTATRLSWRRQTFTRNLATKKSTSSSSSSSSKASTSSRGSQGYGRVNIDDRKTVDPYSGQGARGGGMNEWTNDARNMAENSAGSRTQSSDATKTQETLQEWKMREQGTMGAVGSTHAPFGAKPVDPQSTVWADQPQSRQYQERQQREDAGARSERGKASNRNVKDGKGAKAFERMDEDRSSDKTSDKASGKTSDSTPSSQAKTQTRSHKKFQTMESPETQFGG